MTVQFVYNCGINTSLATTTELKISLNDDLKSTLKVGINKTIFFLSNDIGFEK